MGTKAGQAETVRTAAVKMAAMGAKRMQLDAQSLATSA